jgi:hypothetical protein
MDNPAGVISANAGTGNSIVAGNGVALVFAQSSGITLRNGNEIVGRSGTGNVVTYGLGKETFFGGAGGNVFVAPAQGGTAANNSANFYSLVASPTGGDELDLRTALAGFSGPKSDRSNIGDFVTSSGSGHDTTISIGRSSASFVSVVTLHNVGTSACPRCCTTMRSE